MLTNNEWVTNYKYLTGSKKADAFTNFYKQRWKSAIIGC